MGILSLLALCLSLLTLLVLRTQIKLSLISLLIITGILFNNTMGIERAIAAILPLILILVSYLVCNRSYVEVVAKLSLLKLSVISIGTVIVLYTHKFLVNIINESLKQNYAKESDISLFYFLPFVIVVGVIIIKEVGHGTDYIE